MANYEDDVLTLDDEGITVKNYYLPGRPRCIRYDQIVAVETIPLGFATGRHQLVGIGPFRPQTFFHWDRKRAAKSRALLLDLAGRLHLAITPDHPDKVLAAIRAHSALVDEG